MVGDGLQSLLHFLGVGDLGVLPQGIDHLGRVGPFGTLTDHEFGSNRRIFQRLAQLHTGTDQLVDHVGDLIALHPGVTGRRDDGPRHLRFLRFVGNACLDRNIANNRAVIRADFRRDSQSSGRDNGLPDRAFDRLPPLVHLPPTLGLQFSRARRAAHVLVGFAQPPDLDALRFEAVEV